MNHHRTVSGITGHGLELREAQEYQSVGELAPEAEEVLTHQKGWDGIAGSPPAAEQPIDQAQAHDISFWNRRANRQSLATRAPSGNGRPSYAEDFFNPVNHPADVPPLAGYSLGQGYTQTPTAATNPTPFNQFDDGVISGADAAAEHSGNTGIAER